MKLNLGSGRFPLPGFVNIDDWPVWEPDVLRDIRTGLPYWDATVHAVTVSHVLMYVSPPGWPPLFEEIARVLVPGGVARFTEDNTSHPDSAREGVQPGACTATTPDLVIAAIVGAGLEPLICEPDSTAWHDDSLIQRHHGEPPDVFHIEAVKAPPS